MPTGTPRSWHPFFCEEAVLVTLLMLAMSSLPAQDQVIHLDDETGCAACPSIAMSRVRVLDGGAMPEVGEPLAVHVLPDGRIVAAFNRTSAELKVFPPNSDSVRVVGRRGRGPGEYSFIQFIGSAGGDLHVYDLTLRRRTILDAKLNVERIDPVTDPIRPYGMHFSEEGSFTISGLLQTPDHAGFTLHRFGPDGRHVLSFGPEMDVIDASTARQAERRLAAARRGGLWVADIVRYGIERWDRSGRRIVTLRRTADWFAEEGVRRSVTGEAPPAANVSGIREDPEGLLWVAVTVADRRWREGLRPGPVRHGRRTVEIANADLWLDTVIEVIDPDERKVLATTRIDAALTMGFVGNGHLAGYRLNERDQPVITIWRAVLERRAP